MNKKLLILIEKREHLVTQIEHQRTQLTQSVAPLQAPLALADKGIHLLHFLKEHPFLTSLTGTALISMFSKQSAPRPANQHTSINTWLGRTWLAWRFFKILQPHFFSKK
jgi:hypothetical protein